MGSGNSKPEGEDEDVYKPRQDTKRIFYDKNGNLRYG